MMLCCHLPLFDCDVRYSSLPRSRLEAMRHIYNCEQISIPRAISYETLSDNTSQHIILASDSRNSSFDEAIPADIPKGQLDATTPARFVSRSVSWVDRCRFDSLDND